MKNHLLNDVSDVKLADVICHRFASLSPTERQAMRFRHPIALMLCYTVRRGRYMLKQCLTDEGRQALERVYADMLDVVEKRANS